MAIGVYAFFDKSDSSCLYVGKSINVELRYKRHLLNLRKGKSLKSFQEWFYDRSLEHLEFKILVECSSEELNRYELYFFNELKPRFFGVTPSLSISNNFSDERRENIRKGLKKREELNALIINREELLKYANDDIHSISLASEKLGVSISQLKRLLRKHNIEWSRKSRDVSKRVNDADILKMYFDQKLSTRAIAEILECSQPVIVHRMRVLLQDDPRSSLVIEKSPLGNRC